MDLQISLLQNMLIEIIKNWPNNIWRNQIMINSHKAMYKKKNKWLIILIFKLIILQMRLILNKILILNKV
jgi:hypothetical protein